MYGFIGKYSFSKFDNISLNDSLKAKGLLKSDFKKEIKFKNLKFFAPSNNIEYEIRNNILIAVSGNIFFNNNKNPMDLFYKKYLEKDYKSLVQFNGNYLAIIFDFNKSRFLITTDENSVTPLYYTIIDKNIYFSCDISLLTDLKGISLQYNYSNIMSWILIGGRGFKDQTRFKGIYKLQPGECILIENESFKKIEPTYFSFQPANVSLNELVEEASHALIKSIKVRLKRNKKYYIGLTGGLDSRILLGAFKLAGINRKNLIAYTYGAKNFQEANIAEILSKKMNIEHIKITLNSLDYIKYVNDGLWASSGASIFKHGLHIHMYKNLKDIRNTEGIILGSALDLLVGGTHLPDEIIKLKNKSELLNAYTNLKQKGDVKNYLTYNMKRSEFRNLCKSEKIFKNAIKDTKNLLSYSLEKVEGENMADINDALAYEIRIKRWYNTNLIFPQLSNNLILPTYDNDFLKVIRKVPSNFRKNSLFRKKLLQTLSPELGEVPHDSTMQPAYLPSRFSKKFSNLQEEIDKIKNELWIKERVYLPSTRFDANFLEWFRVQKQWQTFLNDIFFSDKNNLISSLFHRKELRNILHNHYDGRKNNHKIIQFITSLQIMDNLFVKKTSYPSKTFKKLF